MDNVKNVEKYISSIYDKNFKYVFRIILITSLSISISTLGKEQV